MITKKQRKKILEMPASLQGFALKELYRLNPFDMIRDGQLTIISDTKGKCRLIPDNIQNEVLDYVESRWLNNEPCYLIIPKARRTHISTIIEAIIYALIIMGQDNNAIIVADEKKNARNILEMTKVFYNNLDPLFNVVAEKSKGDDFYFKRINSRIVIDSAEKKTVGSSWFFSLIHLTEVSFWNNAETLTNELFQTLPDNKFVLVVLESIGNGVGGYFYNMVQDARKGLNDYKLMFFAWWQKKENVKPIADKSKFKLQSSGIYGNEIAIKEKYHLTDEQMNWRRHNIKNKCGGNLKTFKEKNPSNIDECFQAFGVNVFDLEKLALISKETRPHRWRGILIEEDNKVIFKEDENGWLYIWEKPQFGYKNRYNLPLDTGGIWYKSEKDCADWSYGLVLDRLTKQDVASFHIHAPAYVVAQRLMLLGRYYNTCQITPEINKWKQETDDQGEPIVNILRDNYPNIYYRQKFDEITKQITRKLGFWTDKNTKGLIVDKLIYFVNNIFELGWRINDINIIDELKVYVTDSKKGTYQASEGEKDDRVMTLGIGLLTIDDMPKIRKINEEVNPLPEKSVTSFKQLI